MFTSICQLNIFSELTNVNQALTELTKTVVSLKTMKGGAPYSSPSLSRTSSPSPRSSPLSNMVDDFDEESSSAELDSNMVKFILDVFAILKCLIY